MSPADFEAWVKALDAEKRARIARVTGLYEAGVREFYSERMRLHAALTPDIEGGFRVTLYDERGLYGHRTRRTVAECIETELVEDAYFTPAPGSFDRLMLAALQAAS